MKTRIVRIGNSRGVRLPRVIIDQAGLGDEVVLRAAPGRIIIEAARAPREGWAEAARQMHERGDDARLDMEAPTQFDLRDWQWR